MIGKVPLELKQRCKELPWCEDDPRKLGDTITQFVLDREPFYSRWCQKWFENYQFVYGVQNVRWSKRYDFALDTDFLRRPNPFSLKVQTNISRTVAEGLLSFIYGNVPEWDIQSADKSYTRGKRFATIVQKLLDCYMERLSMDEQFKDAATTFTVMGQVAAYIDWDKNASEMMKIPLTEELDMPLMTDYMADNPLLPGTMMNIPTPVLGPDGMPVTQKQVHPVLDQFGNQMYREEPMGDVRVRMLTPFEYRRSLGSRGMHDTKYIEYFRIMDYDEFIYEYKNIDGQTMNFRDVAPISIGSVTYQFAIKQFMRMQYLTVPIVTERWRQNDFVLGDRAFKNKVLVIEHFDEPKKNLWDKGRRVVIANGKCTHIAEPQYNTKKRGGWHPFAEAQWLSVSPSTNAAGPLNDVIVKNREINQKDTLVATSMRRNMGSALMIKTGIGIDRNQFSGTPGQIIEGSDISPEAIRWLHDTNPMATVIPEMRQQDKDDAFEGAGALDALRGERPPNVSAGYALKQLEEREQKRLSHAKRSFEKFGSVIGEKINTCVHTNVIQLDPNVMGFLEKSGAGSFEPQDIIAYLGQPIDYGVDIKVRPDSMAARSLATEQANVLELAKGPALQRVQSNAKVLDQVLKLFGAEDLRDNSASHRDRAQRENEQFADMGRLGPTEVISPVVFYEDDDDIHMDEHIDDLVKNADEIRARPEILEKRLLHIETHRLQKQTKMQELANGTQMLTAQMQAATLQAGGTVSGQQVAQKQMMMDQQKAMATQAAGPQGAPQAPKPPRPMGQPGATPTDAAAPSQNTQNAPPQGAA